MKSSILGITFFLFSILAFAQTNPARIEIQGYGEMKIAPDQGILQINVNTLQLEFGKAVTELSKKEALIIKKLESLGYKKENIRTSNFSVRENIIWRDGTQYDSGYIASQSMSMEFPNSKENIGKILTAFSAEKSSKVDAEISFSFKLSDELRNKLNAQVLEKAVLDARKNADLLAKYNGVTAKSILRIEYHTNSANQPYPVRNMMYESADYGRASMKSAGGSEGFQAEDITISDNVTIFYSIE
jgi:uncharacterized protein